MERFTTEILNPITHKTEICIKLESDYIKAIEKLAEYEDLEEQGVLLKLPCKVGDTVYSIAEDCGGDALDCRNRDCQNCVDFYRFVEENKFDTYMRDEIGKTVFLAKEEAESALRGMEGRHETD